MKQTGHYKDYPEVGVCGLDCGLCPRYYTDGPSRCPGCAGPGFYEKHPSCSYITCCVKKKGLEVCGECRDFPCSRFKNEDEYLTAKESPSYPSPKKIISNQNYIREQGIRKFVEQQKRRISILETMLENYNEGRSKSLFCRASVLLDEQTLVECMEEANRMIVTKNITDDNKKLKAAVLKDILIRNLEGVS